jgi:hypothetical protein
MLFEFLKVSVETENNIRKTIRDTMNYYSAFMVSVISGLAITRNGTAGCGIHDMSKKIKYLLTL